jgi:hypothetical protein
LLAALQKLFEATGILDRSNPELVEKYAVIGSGTAECNSCQYFYDPSVGDGNYPVPKGVRFEVRVGLYITTLSPHGSR